MMRFLYEPSFLSLTVARSPSALRAKIYRDVAICHYYSRLIYKTINFDLAIRWTSSIDAIQKRTAL